MYIIKFFVILTFKYTTILKFFFLNIIMLLKIINNLKIVDLLQL